MTLEPVGVNIETERLELIGSLVLSMPVKSSTVISEDAVITGKGISYLKVEFNVVNNGVLSIMCWKSGEAGLDVLLFKLFNLGAFFLLTVACQFESGPRWEVTWDLTFEGAGDLPILESPPEDDDIIKTARYNNL